MDAVTGICETQRLHHSTFGSSSGSLQIDESNIFKEFYYGR